MAANSTKGFWDEEQDVILKTSETKTESETEKEESVDFTVEEKSDILKNEYNNILSEKKNIKKKPKEQKEYNIDFIKEVNKIQPEQAILKRKNKKDFIIIVSVIVILIAGIFFGTFCLYNSGNRKIYSYIDSGSYAVAYKEINQLYDIGDNVDSLVIAFMSSCVEHKEYRRAVSVIYFLSDDGVSQNIEYLKDVATQMQNEGNQKQADEIIFVINNNEVE